MDTPLDKFKKFLKQIRYFFEAIIVRLGILIFELMGLERSSNFGAAVAKFVGKKLSVHKLARENIKKSLPHLSDDEVEKVLDDMWDNLGRIVGEFSHVTNFSGKELMQYAEFDAESLENIKYIKQNYHGGIIFSAHLGNWEIGPKVFLETGLNVKAVYRPLNNNFVDEMTTANRGVELIPKSTKGNKQIIQEIKNGNYIAILADQKMSDGMLVPFFGRDALTTVSIARLALKYDIPLIPARAIRDGKGFKFKIRIEKPIEFEKTKEVSEDIIVDLMTKVNIKLEDWIREHPSQWFWVHNRWKK